MKTQKKFAERRKNTRCAVNIPVQYRLYAEADREPRTEWMHGTIENVCIDGLQLKVECNDKHIELLTNECVVIAVDFIISKPEHAITGDSKLIYFNMCNDTAEKDIKTILLGVSFRHMDEKDKRFLADFVESIHLKKDRQPHLYDQLSRV